MIKASIFENFAIPTVGGLLGTGLGACFGGIPGAVALGGLGSSIGLEIRSTLFLERQKNDLIYRLSNQAQEIIRCSANHIFNGAIAGGFYWLVSRGMENSCNQNSETLSCQSLRIMHVAFVGVTTLKGVIMIYRASQLFEQNLVTNNPSIESQNQFPQEDLSLQTSNQLSIIPFKQKKSVNNISYNHCNLEVVQQTPTIEPITDLHVRFIQTQQGDISEPHFVPHSQRDNPYRVSQKVEANYLGLAFVELDSGYFSTNPKLSQSTDVVAWSNANEIPSYHSAKECRDSLKLFREWKIPQTTYVSDEVYDTAEKTVSVYLFVTRNPDKYLVAQVAFNDKLILQQPIHYSSNITRQNSPLENRIASLMHSKPILFYTTKKQR